MPYVEPQIPDIRPVLLEFQRTAYDVTERAVETFTETEHGDFVHLPTMHCMRGEVSLPVLQEPGFSST